MAEDRVLYQAAPVAGTDFGRLLKSLREMRGISQSKLAELADFDHSYVSRLETGVRMPTRDATQRLADALGLTGAQTDGLMASVGFLPADPGHFLASEPVARDLLALLRDPAVSDKHKEQVRAGVALLVGMVR